MPLCGATQNNFGFVEALKNAQIHLFGRNDIKLER